MSLRERRDILSLAAGADAGVLVTLVSATGSTYRQPGARLLALPDGRTAGTISGGCLEADLLRKAQWRVRDGAAMQTYDTGFDEDAEVPFGLGCGGAVDLLLEDLRSAEARAGLEAIGATLAGAPRTLVTQLPTHSLGFGRIVLDGRGDVLFASEMLETERVVDLRAVARRGQASGVDTQHLAVEHLAPAQRLLLCGAGQDARPVVRLASELGWTVVVADGRAQHARPERFPAAQAVLPTSVLSDAEPDAPDAVVIMTHSFEQDRGFLTQLLRLAPERRPRYIGLLGARHRSALLLQQAAEAAGSSLDEAMRSVHAPVGLELGGEGPESIALAVVAEVQAALHAGAAQPIAPRGMSASDVLRFLEQAPQGAASQPWCALDTPSSQSVATGRIQPDGMHEERV